MDVQRQQTHATLYQSYWASEVFQPRQNMCNGWRKLVRLDGGSKPKAGYYQINFLVEGVLIVTVGQCAMIASIRPKTNKMTKMMD